jgi:hypothetical protein
VVLSLVLQPRSADGAGNGARKGSGGVVDLKLFIVQLLY